MPVNVVQVLAVPASRILKQTVSRGRRHPASRGARIPHSETDGTRCSRGFPGGSFANGPLQMCSSPRLLTTGVLLAADRARGRAQRVPDEAVLRAAALLPDGDRVRLFCVCVCVFAYVGVLFWLL